MIEAVFDVEAPGRLVGTVARQPAGHAAHFGAMFEQRANAHVIVEPIEIGQITHVAMRQPGRCS